ncbi:MAG TPA: ACP S-malonyltransferase, partial [Puia sp.]|nr:ACP S-malonyltransferase [Puia sp.]
SLLNPLFVAYLFCKRLLSMKHAYVFPGQGSQYPGMGKSHYENSVFAKKLFEQANEIAGFRISDIMFHGTEADLRQTRVTQPAVFLHSVIAFKSIDNIKPDMVAGHSLGEFSALVANGVLSFEDALQLVFIRATAMQKACEKVPSTMAAVLSLEDARVESICADVQRETGEIVVPANYNCPGQLVISGSLKGVELACERMKAAGAKRALVLPVGGAFHSPLMEPARDELKAAIEKTTFYNPICSIYQNVTARAVFDRDEIKKNLIDQLTGAVRWTQSVQLMIADGASMFTEVGPGKVLQGLIVKINKQMEVNGVS